MRREAEFRMPLYGIREDNAHCQLHCDAPRASQIISNLLSNAIKYTERGGIRLSLGAMASENKGLMLRISVADTGAG